MRQVIIDEPVNTCVKKILVYFDKINNEADTLFKSFLPETKPILFSMTDESEIKFDKIFPSYFGYNLLKNLQE